jgi:hypothetical protein
MARKLSQAQKDLLLVLHERDELELRESTSPTGERDSCSIHGLTRGNSSGNRLKYALTHGGYGAAAAALKRQGLVVSKFSTAARVDLWTLTDLGAEVASALTMSVELTAPLVIGVRSRLSSLAAKRVPSFERLTAASL